LILCISYLTFLTFRIECTLTVIFIYSWRKITQSSHILTLNLWTSFYYYMFKFWTNNCLNYWVTFRWPKYLISEPYPTSSNDLCAVFLFVRLKYRRVFRVPDEHTHTDIITNINISKFENCCLIFNEQKTHWLLALTRLLVVF